MANELVNKYFWPHASAVIAHINAVITRDDEREVLYKLIQKPQDKFHTSWVRDNVFKRSLEIDQVERILNKLERGHWVRLVKTASTGGRPLTHWEVTLYVDKFNL